jgi:hypothetical protein
MRSIVFNVRPEASGEKQETLLARLGRLPGIARIGCLSPHSKDPILRRMCFAQVADDADVENLLAEVRLQPEVEQASLPAERKLNY